MTTWVDGHILLLGRMLALTAIVLVVMEGPSANAQEPATAQRPSSAQQPAPADQPLPTPAMTGLLQTAPPHSFDAGPFGKLQVTGIISGMGLWEGNHIPGDDSTQGDLSNGQVFVQKTDGWWQFYLQAGAYNLPALATPYLSPAHAMSGFYGPLPAG